MLSEHPRETQFAPRLSWSDQFLVALLIDFQRLLLTFHHWKGQFFPIFLMLTQSSPSFLVRKRWSEEKRQLGVIPNVWPARMANSIIMLDILQHFVNIAFLRKHFSVVFYKPSFYDGTFYLLALLDSRVKILWVC